MNPDVASRPAAAALGPPAQATPSPIPTANGTASAAAPLPSPPPAASAVPAWMEPAVKALTLAGAASLLLSCAYDWAFFRVAHTSFAELPTTVADHARSALNWLPSVTMIGAGVAVAYLLLPRVIYGLGGFLLAACLWFWGRKLGIGTPFDNAPWTWALSTWLGVFPLLWLPLSLAVAYRVVRHGPPGRWAGVALMALMLLPSTLSFVAGFGAIHAEAAIRAAAAPAGCQLLDRGEGRPALRAAVLRSFEKAVLAWDPATRAPMLVPWGEIKAIIYEGPGSPSPPPLLMPRLNSGQKP